MHECLPARRQPSSQRHRPERWRRRKHHKWHTVLGMARRPPCSPPRSPLETTFYSSVQTHAASNMTDCSQWPARAATWTTKNRARKQETPLSISQRVRSSCSSRTQGGPTTSRPTEGNCLQLGAENTLFDDRDMSQPRIQEMHQQATTLFLAVQVYPDRGLVLSLNGLPFHLGDTCSILSTGLILNQARTDLIMTQNSYVKAP